ncbi:MAG TPA: peptidase C1A, partial [Actinomycetota bacterium]|nr:peptidase C1A [Actinomycetota bacterium]
DEATFTWNPGALFGAGIASPPVMIQGQHGMLDERGPHGNFELCVAAGGQVQHWWRANSSDEQWRRGATFGHDVREVTGLCQGSWGRNLEVLVVRTDQRLQHYWRDQAGWHEGPVIGPA